MIIFVFFLIEKHPLKDHGKLQRRGGHGRKLIQPFSVEELVYDLMTYRIDCTVLLMPPEFDVNVANFCCRKVCCLLEYPDT